MNDSPQRKSWFQRNWIWFVPTSMLGGIAIIAIFALVIASLVFGIIRDSEVLQQAIVIASKNAEVTDVTGTPVEPGFLVSGSLRTNNEDGTADLRSTIKGPDGEGSLKVIATRTSGAWHYDELTFTPDGGAPIDLTPTAIPE